MAIDVDFILRRSLVNFKCDFFVQLYSGYEDYIVPVLLPISKILSL